MNADEQAFVDRYEAMALRAMERHGFAVPVASDDFRSAARREVLAKNRTDRAMHALTELQQWLVDDDPRVRQTARAGLRKLLYTAYVGDRAEERSSTGSVLALPDRLLLRLTRRSFGQDAPPPWWATEGTAAFIRTLNVLLTVFLALCTSSSLAGGQLLYAAPLLLLTVLSDVMDGAFGRLVRLRNPRVRWASFVGSHAADSLILFGVVAGLLGSSMDLAVAVGGAATLSLLAALARVSALHAGYRYWRSAGERLVRWCGVGVYIAGAWLDMPAVGAGALALLLTASACYEFGKVARKIERLDVSAGGFIMVTEAQTVDSWRIEDDEESPIVGRDPVSAGRLLRHTPHRRRRVRGSGGHMSLATSAPSLLMLTAVVAVAAAQVIAWSSLRPGMGGVDAANASVNVGVVATGAAGTEARGHEKIWATGTSSSRSPDRWRPLCDPQRAAGPRSENHPALAHYWVQKCSGTSACAARDASLGLGSTVGFSATHAIPKVAKGDPGGAASTTLACPWTPGQRKSTVGGAAYAGVPKRRATVDSPGQ